MYVHTMRKMLQEKASLSLEAGHMQCIQYKDPPAPIALLSSFNLMPSAGQMCSRKVSKRAKLAARADCALDQRVKDIMQERYTYCDSILTSEYLIVYDPLAGIPNLFEEFILQ